MIIGSEILLTAPDGRKLMKGLNFEIFRSDRVAFCGPNGCGKSTLLRSICLPTRNCKGITRNIRLEEVSYLPTRPLDLLLPWMRVRNMVQMFEKLANKKSPANSSLKNDFSTYLDFDFSRFGEQEVFRLSSGQQALLAIFCSIVQGPRLIVADEIFAVLSSKAKADVAKFFFDSTQKYDLSMIVATHDMDFISALDAKIISLDKYIIDP